MGEKRDNYNPMNCVKVVDGDGDVEMSEESEDEEENDEDSDGARDKRSNDIEMNEESEHDDEVDEEDSDEVSEKDSDEFSEEQGNDIEMNEEFENEEQPEESNHKVREERRENESEDSEDYYDDVDTDGKMNCQRMYDKETTVRLDNANEKEEQQKHDNEKMFEGTSNEQSESQYEEVDEEVDEAHENHDQDTEDRSANNQENSELNTPESLIIRSNKGGDKLCFDGRMYILHRVCKNFIRWRCTMHSLKSVKCKGALTTRLDKTHPLLVVEHDHVKDVEAVNRDISVSRMKSMARDNFAKPAQIFAEEVQRLPNNTRARLPLEESVKRTLRNQRSREYPREPDNLQELTIEGGGENQRFLVKVILDRWRVILFATDPFLRLLGEAKQWYMDGNFDLAPSLFLQLYVLRVLVNGFYITVAYALLERKTEASYTYLLQTIFDKCAELGVFPDPEMIHVDFEKAMVNAIHRVIGEEVVILGCFYHLTQSTYRKIQDLHLTKLYKEDESFNLYCAMIDALAFLPTTDVVKGMEFLEKVVPETARALLSYFDATYVRGASRRIGRPAKEGEPVKMRRISPLFPIEKWNVHDATFNGGGRTNNSTEGWNNRFEHIVGNSHPSIWVLIDKMRQEVAVDTTKLVQYDIGVKQNKKKRSACEEREAKLVRLCGEYVAQERSLENFLKCVSHTLRFRKI